ncbi:MAG TPA: CsbD family protein [Acidimicrobiales bacterium]
MDDIKGRTKEAVGDLTDDRELQTEGKIDQGKAEVKETAKNVTDKVGDTLKKLTD